MSRYVVHGKGYCSDCDTYEDAVTTQAKYRGGTIYREVDPAAERERHAPIEIITAMCLEADHQDAKGYSSEHPVSGWLLIMQSEMTEASEAWVRGRGDQDALREVLQVMTVGLRCLQQHGIVTRWTEGGAA